MPFAVLKVQLKKLVEQYDKTGKGVIFTRDLITLIGRFEESNDILLLTDEQKKAILPYTSSNPDLEMTPDDILNLLKIVCTCPQVSISAPTSSRVLLDSRPRLSPPLSSNKSMPWKKRRASFANNNRLEHEELRVNTCYYYYRFDIDVLLEESDSI